jgi:hypothetical protein
MTDATLVPIGELLTRAGVLTERSLNDALAKARERSLPLGKVLIMLGYIKAKDLRAAVEAQSLINDGMLSLELATTAITMVSRHNYKFPEALGRLGWKKQRVGSTNRIGELLVEAEAVTWDQLDEALNTSTETGLPVGRVLVFRKYLSSEVLLACLTAQKLIREGVISREQAIQGLRAVRLRQVGFEESLAASGIYRRPARRSTPIGYLLVQAGLMDQTQLMTCMEMSLTTEKPIGDVFVEQGLVPRAVMEASVQIQEMVDNSTLSPELAAQAIRQAFTGECSVARAIALACLPRFQVKERALIQELLTLAGFCDARDMKPLTGAGFAEIERELLSGAVVDEKMFYALLMAVYFIQKGFLLQEDAIMALHECKTRKVSMHEALKQLGWTVSSRRTKS